MVRWLVVVVLGAFLFWSPLLSYHVVHEFLPAATCEFARLGGSELTVLACDWLPTLDLMAQGGVVLGLGLFAVGAVGVRRGTVRRPATHRPRQGGLPG